MDDFVQQMEEEDEELMKQAEENWNTYLDAIAEPYDAFITESNDIKNK
jgi:hypothetical protein